MGISKIEEKGRSLNDEDLTALEQRLSVVLPERYKAFLKQNNGGRLEPEEAFPIRGMPKNPKGGIQMFFGVERPIKSSNLEWNYQTMRSRLPRSLFPIACDGSGDLICLSLDGDDKGYVYFWDFYAQHRPPTMSNVYFVASSFEEFLDSIHFHDFLEGLDLSSMNIKRQLDH